MNAYYHSATLSASLMTKELQISSAILSLSSVIEYLCLSSKPLRTNDHCKASLPILSMCFSPFLWCPMTPTWEAQCLYISAIFCVNTCNHLVFSTIVRLTGCWHLESLSTQYHCLTHWVLTKVTLTIWEACYCLFFFTHADRCIIIKSGSGCQGMCGPLSKQKATVVELPLTWRWRNPLFLISIQSLAGGQKQTFQHMVLSFTTSKRIKEV